MCVCFKQLCSPVLPPVCVIDGNKAGGLGEGVCVSGPCLADSREQRREEDSGEERSGAKGKGRGGSKGQTDTGGWEPK